MTNEDNHNTPHHEHSVSHYLALGGALVTGSIILAPYVLPMVGVGSVEDTQTAFNDVCGASKTGSGFAGSLNESFKHIPVIGENLASGGFFTTAITAGIGIGGYALGKKIEETHDGESINWGKIIRYGALVTSALIALPALLTGVNMGLTYIALAASGAALASVAAETLNDSIGTIGQTAAHSSGLSGGMALIPHLLTCGASFFPAIGSFFINEKRDEEEISPRAQPSFAERELQRRIDAATPAMPMLTASAAPPLTSADQAGIHVDIITDTPPRAGVPCHVNLVLRHSDTGKPLTAEEIAVVHTERIHVLLIDDAMGDYHHVHPQPTQQPGIYSLEFTPQANAHYSAWIDLTEQATGNNPYIKCEVPSDVAPSTTPPAIAIQHTATADGLVFHWQEKQPLTQGQGSMVDVTITDTQGKPITDLQPIMGAFAHLIGFSGDGNSLVHSHPTGKEPTCSGERGGSPLSFHIEPQRAGDTKFFLQVQREGRVTCVPFGTHVRAQQHSQSAAMPSDTWTAHTHTHHHADTATARSI